MTGEPKKIKFHAPGDVWFFAYGSLMWDPGFPYEEQQPAHLRGYHRTFCVNSRTYRGTAARPGLVLGLDRGGACIGRAYRVAADRRTAVAWYLEERELPEDIYICRPVPVTTPVGRVSAYAFVVNRHHFLYTGKLSDADIVARLATCAGSRGTNRAYLENTVRHLDELGIREGRLHRILRAVAQRPPGLAAGEGSDQTAADPNIPAMQGDEV
jgi:cation transport protein ChaC